MRGLHSAQDSGVAKTPQGQLITAAAMIDDVLSLVVLVRSRTCMLILLGSYHMRWSYIQVLMFKFSLCTGRIKRASQVDTQFSRHGSRLYHASS